MKKSKNPLPYLHIRVTGKRLEVRPYKASDFKALQESHRARLSPVNKFDEPIPTAREANYKSFRERIKRHRAHGRDGQHFIFGVFERKTSSYVGQIDLFTINKQLRWANIGYHFQNQHFGKGYASEAGRLGLRIAFDLLKLHRVEAGTELNNKASQRVAISIGLKPEGIRRKFFPGNGGIDMRFYANNTFDWKRA